MTRVELVACLCLLGCGGGGARPAAAPVAPGTTAAVPAGVWLVAEPRQAGNPWDGVPVGDTRSSGLPIAELESVDAWVEGQGGDLVALGLLWPTEPIVVCAALSCPRGDRLLVLARPEDEAMLVAQGFARVTAGTLLVRGMPHCEAPWRDAGAISEAAQRATQWTVEQGGEPAWLGFVWQAAAASGEPCDVVDWLVVESRSADGTARLRAQGFSQSP